jgi:hypothetical protein
MKLKRLESDILHSLYPQRFYYQTFPDNPIGDPFGGPAYGRRDMPFGVVAAIGTIATAATAGVAAAGGALAVLGAVGTVVAAVGVVLSVVGLITGDKTLTKVGGIMGLAGGVTAIASGVAAGAAEGTAAAAETGTTQGAQSTVQQAITPNLQTLASPTTQGVTQGTAQGVQGATQGVVSGAQAGGTGVLTPSLGGVPSGLTGMGSGTVAGGTADIGSTLSGGLGLGSTSQYATQGANLATDVGKTVGTNYGTSKSLFDTLAAMDTRQTLMGVGQVGSGIIQGVVQSNAANNLLDYQKQQDAINRGIQAQQLANANSVPTTTGIQVSEPTAEQIKAQQTPRTFNKQGILNS